MASTYTTNIGIEKPATGDQSGTWGDTTNTNFDIIDQGTNGVATVTLSVAGTSGSPNSLPISNGALSDGRNRFINFNDGADLGATAYVQLDPNDAEKIVHIRNSLSGSRSLILFQGTYSASNDFEVPNGADVLVKFDGGGASATVTDVNANLTPTKLTTSDANISDSVGIGTTSPYSYGKLTVKAGNGTQLVLDNAGEQYTQMYFLNNGTEKGSIWTDNTLSLFSFIARTGMGMNFYTNGIERLRIDSTGKVGIGESSPDSLLQLTGDTATITIEDSGSYVADSVTSRIYFNGRDSASSNRDLANIAVSQHAGTNGTGSIDFQTRISGTTASRMRIDSSGRVGIGTTSPTGNVNASSLVLEVNSSGANPPEILAGGQNAEISIAGGSSASYLWSTGAYPLIMATNATERMRIDSSGNVGIGVTPAFPLVVKTDTTTNVAMLDIVGAATVCALDNSNASAELRLAGLTLSFSGGGGSGSEHMRIDSSGNVGIGQSSPPYLLTAEGDKDTWISRIYNTGSDANASALLVRSDATAAHDAIVFGVYADSEYKLVVRSDGNVGIGQANPTSPNGATDFLHIGKSTNQDTSIVLEDAVEIWEIYNNDNLYFNFDTTNVMTLQRVTGNVGIGTTPESFAKLEVKTSTDKNIAIFDNAAAPTIGSITDAGASQALRIAGFPLIMTGAGGAGSEAMRIDTSNNLRIGTAGAVITSEKVSIDGGLGITKTDDYPLGLQRGGASYGQVTTFFNYSGTLVGSISVAASSTSYNTSSDARLKENITDADDSGSKIDAIQVRQFDWIADGSHQEYGMIAQELQSVAPEAVSGNPDSDEMMGVDYSKLVPMLIKEVQSLRARVAELENN